MIIVIDNYDSFAYNLVQYVGEMRPDLEVYRNDKITIEEIEKKSPDHIIISPGPCTPKEAGISNDVIRHLGPKLPVLGVCLGHECIGDVYGGRIVRAGRLMHGKTSMIYHSADPIFRDVTNPFEATRYHSLILERETSPGCLDVIAETAEKEIMGVKHREYPVWGVQFHPESILTTEGKKIIRNFLEF